MSEPEDFPGHSKSPQKANNSALLLTLASGAVIAGTYAAIFRFGADIYAPLGMMLVAIVLGICAIAVSVAIDNSTDPIRGTRRLWLVLSALLLIHGSVALLCCKWIPGTTIDTFTFQRDACKNLMRGIDPYGTTQFDIYDQRNTALFYGAGMVANGRVQVGFQYPPLTLLWALPGYFLGDVRYSYIFAVIISALFSFAIFPNARGLLIASILLLNPLTLFIENRCWTEPLVLMLLSATLYATVRKRWWLPITLGLLLASKQYNFLALPFIGCLVYPFQWKSYLRLLGWSTAVATATMVPFACWNFGALWHDLVLFHLAQPFRQDAVSFAVPFPIMLKIGPVFGGAFILWAIQNGARNVAMFAAGYGIALLLFVSTSKQAFANYYFLIAQSLLLAVAVLPPVSNIRRLNRDSFR